MITEKTWRVETVLWLMMGIFTSIVIGSLIVSLMTGGDLKTVPDETRPLIFLVNTLSFQGIILILTAFFLRFNETTWREAFGFTRERMGSTALLSAVTCALFLPCGLLLQKLVMVLMAHTDVAVESQIAVQVLQKNLRLPEQLLIGLSTVVVAPFAEEVLFRGIIYPTVKQVVNPQVALWGVAIFFGLIHYNIIAMLPLTLFGVVLTLIYERTGNLAAPILTHTLFNLANYLMLVSHSSFGALWKSIQQFFQ